MFVPDIKCNVIIDSCCDLPRAVIDIPGVELLQFPFMLDGEEHFDDMFESLPAREFYNRMRKGAEVSTAQIPMPVITDAFQRAIESGVPTVYLGFTSGLSGNFNTAQMVRDQLVAENPGAELYVVDTHLASIAEGLLVYEAVRQRAKGLTAKELAAWAEEARFFVNELFTLDELEWLRKGGRIPASVAFAGAKLDVKPMLDISMDGKLSLSGVARGRKKGIRQLAEFYKRNAAELGCGSSIVIGSSDCPKDVERLKDELVKIDDTVLFFETSIGPVIGSHVGPGMLAISFMGKDTREDLSVSDRIAKRVRSKE
ncbi:MAG: DegV family protein [Eggerthellaceae bacterium]|nr:DegV family protein [Eggerthellaceae bacterium]